MRRLLLAAAIAALWAGPAFAATVLEGDVQLGAGNLIQTGRLIRGGLQQDFSGSEPYPGTNNPTVQYHYTTFAVGFAPNASQDVYYQINFDDDAADLFASAYNGSYNPAAKQQNWLGDAGSSGNYIFYPGTPGDPRYFQVKVAAGGSLTFVVNDTVPGLGTSTSAHYLIEAFSDVDYDDFPSPSAVPEPGSWAMLIIGMGAVGCALRRRGRGSAGKSGALRMTTGEIA